MEDLAEQDRFHYWSLSHQTLYTSHEAKLINIQIFIASTLPSSHPSPRIDRSQSMSTCCKIPDHSIFVRINQLCCAFFHSTFTQDLTASIWHNKASSHVFFFIFFSSSQCWPNHLYHHLLQRKKPLKRLRKPSNHRLLSDKIKEYINTWMTDFLWRMHEADVDTEKSGISMRPSFCRPYCAMVETGVVNKNDCTRWLWAGTNFLVLLPAPHTKSLNRLAVFGD